MKKFILFLVEGKNDERELYAILHSHYSENLLNLYEPVIYHNGGDVTSAAKLNVNNIQI